MANIIDSQFQIARTPAQIRAALDRVLANSVEIPYDPNERGYKPVDPEQGHSPATWFRGAELTSPTIMNEWSADRHRVTFRTESKWMAPWHLIDELIRAGLDLRVLWWDDDGNLVRIEDTDRCVNVGGFGEIRSIRNGVIYETTERTFAAYQGDSSVTQLVPPVADGSMIDISKIELGFVEVHARKNEWLDNGFVVKLLPPTMVEIDEPEDFELETLMVDDQQRMMSRFFETLSAHDEKGRSAREIKREWKENRLHETLTELGIK
jgi:hypothetical protein